MNDKENGGISLPMVISLIKKLGGDGSGAGGEYLPLSGGEMNGEIDMANDVGIIGFTPSGTKRSLIKLNSSSQTDIGDAQGDVIIRSKQPPTWNNGSKNHNFITSNGGLLTNRLALANNISLMGRDAKGQEVSLIKINAQDEIVIGSDTNWLKLSANSAPLWSGTAQDTPLATETYVADNYLPLAGGAMHGNITFDNNVAMQWNNKTGVTKRVLTLNNADNIILGDASTPLQFSTSTRPKIKVLGGAQQELAYLSDIDTKVGKDYRATSETLEINGVVSTIATFDAPDVAQALANIQNYEITFNYSYVSSDGKLIIENHLGTSDNNELMQIDLDIPSAKNVINIKAHALDSTISITNFVITCHIRPLNLDI